MVLAACLGEGVWLVWVAVVQSSSHSLHTGLIQLKIPLKKYLKVVFATTDFAAYCITSVVCIFITVNHCYVNISGLYFALYVIHHVFSFQYPVSAGPPFVPVGMARLIFSSFSMD